MTLEEVETQYPRALAERTGKGNNTFTAPGGEDTTHMLKRVRRFYTRTVERRDNAENILIVAHGGSIRALIVCLLGLTDDHFWSFRVDSPRGASRPRSHRTGGSLSVISNELDGRVLELWNDTNHLNSAALGSSE